MYVVVALVMLTRALIEAVMMRTQQAVGTRRRLPVAGALRRSCSRTHGSIMIFFMAMPFLTGLINYVVPLQIGARDVSFPLLNSVGLALTAAGAALVMISLVFGTVLDRRLVGLSRPTPAVPTAPASGPDYWIWAVTLAGIGTTLSGHQLRRDDLQGTRARA